MKYIESANSPFLVISNSMTIIFAATVANGENISVLELEKTSAPQHERRTWWWN